MGNNPLSVALPSVDIMDVIMGDVPSDDIQPEYSQNH